MPDLAPQADSSEVASQLGIEGLRRLSVTLWPFCMALKSLRDGG